MCSELWCAPAQESLVSVVKKNVGNQPSSKRNKRSTPKSPNGSDQRDFNKFVADIVADMISDWSSYFGIKTANETESVGTTRTEPKTAAGASTPSPKLNVEQKNLDVVLDLMAFLNGPPLPSSTSSDPARAESLSRLQKRLQMVVTNKQNPTMSFRNRARQVIDSEICRALIEYVSLVEKQKKAESKKSSQDDEAFWRFRKRLVMKLTEYQSYVGSNDDRENPLRIFGRVFGRDQNPRSKLVIQYGNVSGAWTSRTRLRLDEAPSARRNESPEASLPVIRPEVQTISSYQSSPGDVPWFKDPRR
jgi:hypothetical protein